jgi:hypothetical protein
MAAGRLADPACPCRRVAPPLPDAAWTIGFGTSADLRERGTLMRC